MKRAVYLDRDGVLVEDVHLLTRPDQLRLLPEVPPALRRLAGSGFELVVVTNQTVVARGLCTEAEVAAVHGRMISLIESAGGPRLNWIYVCPHHPNATLAQYRVDCECRKPRPGLLQVAARELSIDVRGSFMVGDRPSDIQAGANAGCRTVLVTTGRNEAPAIESPEAAGRVMPDLVCNNLAEAADWILQRR